MHENVVSLFQIGDKVRVKMREYTSNQARYYTGKIEAVTEKFITVHTGKYRVTVLKADLICGDAQIELVGKAGGKIKWIA